MTDILRRQYGVTVKAAASGRERAFDVIASTDDVDLCGDVVVQDWDLRRYLANPIVLYFHNFVGDDPEDTLPVGFSDNVGVVDGKLQMTVNFVDEKANPLAEMCFQGFAQGSLRAVSVGFTSKTGRMETRNGRDVYVLSGNELLELSVCPVPINPNAVARAKALDEIRALVGAATNDHQEPSMRTIAKSLNLKEDASEAEILSVVTSIQAGAKALEGKVLEATGTKSVDEALGAIKAGAVAVEQLAKANASLAIEKAAGEKRDREALVAKAVADGKVTPALKAWALATQKSADGADEYVEPLATVKRCFDNLTTIPALAKSGKVVEEASGGATANGKGWEDLTPAEKHNIHEANIAEYDALKADWVKRGKPAVKAAQAR